MIKRFQYYIIDKVEGSESKALAELRLVSVLGRIPPPYFCPLKSQSNQSNPHQHAACYMRYIYNTL